MKVNFQNYSIGAVPFNSNYNGNKVSDRSYLNNSISSDVFVKNTNNVSFSGTDRTEKVKDMAKDMAAIGIIGAPFVLSIAAASYAMSNMNPKHIFLPDGSYFMSTEQLKTPVITADAEEGILKIKNTPINIDASKYDVSDMEHGIFRNYDGTVDIDLANNKYIDKINGVFIDPDSKISMIKNSEGVYENLAIPNFEFPNFEGSSIGIRSAIRRRLTRSEFIEQNGHTPETDSLYSHKEDKIPESTLDRYVDPDDNRNISQKIMDFFNPFSPDSSLNNMYDRSRNYDIFGREIVDIRKSDGSIIKVGIDENLQNILSKYHLKKDSLGEISEFFDKIRLNEYILAETPVSNMSFGYEVDVEPFSKFIQKMSENHSDVARTVSHDAISETFNNDEIHDSLLNTLKTILTNVTGG